MSPADPSDVLTIEAAAASDIPAVTAIYAPYVRDSLVSFELDPPDEAELRRRYDTIVGAGFPYLVARRAGIVVGYAYAAPYRPRPAYRYTAENSIYVRRGCTRAGIGQALMTALLAACEARGLRQVVAVIGDSGNTASIELHRRLGFVMVGTIRAAGYKLARWADVVLMQRSLGPGDGAPP